MMSWKAKLWILIPLAAVAVGCVVLYRVTPENTWWMPPCVFHRLTGLHCPGCGTARALHKLLHGDLVGAWRMNQLTLLLIPVMVYLIMSACRAKPGAKRESPPLWAPWVIVALVAGFWIARNIPMYPFDLLAPH